jgi:hypothetical protein
MPTIFTVSQAETRSISIEATPAAVFAFVADPYNLPRWAPGFASEVRPDGERWIVTSGGAELTIAVLASEQHGTVDLVAGPELNIGAFSRVLPNAGGSEYLFTLFFPGGTPEDAITAQMDVVDEELRTIRALVTAAAT